MSKTHLIRLSVAFAVLLLIVGGPEMRSRAHVPGVASPQGCWSIVPTPSINAQASEITAMSASSADNVWAIGSALNNSANGKSGGFAMRYNGSGWQITSTGVIS